MKFKKLLSLLLVCCCVFAVFSPAAVAAQEETPKTFRLLSVGNSFSDDAVAYLYRLAKNAGVKTVVVASMDLPGCDLSVHRINMKSDIPTYKYTKCGNTTGGKTRIYNNISILSALNDENWDYVTIQQSSTLSGVKKSYNEDLDYVIDYIQKNKPLKTTRLCWHMTWAYGSDFNEDKFEPYHFDQVEMYDAICNAVKKKIASNKNFAFIIPAGTAIQNLRTSYIGDNLNRDGRHLNDIGRYTASLMFLRSFGFSVDGVEWLPNSGELCRSYLPAIKAAVNDAFESPFSLTDESAVCNHDGSSESRYNTVVKKRGKSPNCTDAGLTDGLYCKACKTFVKAQKPIPQNEEHDFKYTVLCPATTVAAGECIATCTRCNKSERQSVSKIKKATAEKKAYDYTGKPIEPAFNVAAADGKTLVFGEDYTVKYLDGRTGIGVHRVRIIFKNRYFGSLETEFTITPKRTSLKKLKAESGGFSAKWKTRKNISGYVLEYSKSPTFDDGSEKLVKLRDRSTANRSFAAKKGVYYVRIRTFLDKSSKTLYSVWSEAEKIKVK